GSERGGGERDRDEEPQHDDHRPPPGARGLGGHTVGRRQPLPPRRSDQRTLHHGDNLSYLASHLSRNSKRSRKTTKIRPDPAETMTLHPRRVSAVLRWLAAG